MRRWVVHGTVVAALAAIAVANEYLEFHDPNPGELPLTGLRTIAGWAFFAVYAVLSTIGVALFAKSRLRLVLIELVSLLLAPVALGLYFGFP